jgi:ArsR family transcriptional regulator
MKRLAARFAALADPTRLEMLALLLDRGELCVCHFVDALGITQSKASRHLRTLFHAGFLEDRRAGLWVHYAIASDLDDDRKAMLASLSEMLAKRDLAALRSSLDRALAADPVERIGANPRAPRAVRGARK